MYEVPIDRRQSIIHHQRLWINELSKISIQEPRISHTWQDGVTPGKRYWIRHHLWEYPYQYRVNLHNEIPYDLDVIDYDLLKIVLRPLLDFLDGEGIPYVMAGSGGNKSIHVQIFFEPSILCVRYGWREVRCELWEWILDQAEVPHYMRGLGKYDDDTINKGMNYPYDKSVAVASDLSQGRVMRDFGGYRKGRYHKTLLIERPPARREDIYGDVIRFPSEVKLWNPRKIILQELEFDYELNYPLDCFYCPVNPDWMISFEQVMDDGSGFEPVISNHPKICRQCGRYKWM